MHVLILSNQQLEFMALWETNPLSIICGFFSSALNARFYKMKLSIAFLKVILQLSIFSDFYTACFRTSNSLHFTSPVTHRKLAFKLYKASGGYENSVQQSSES